MSPRNDVPGPALARKMWRALEPFHAVTYFAPESKAASDALGCKGWWMGYFGFRAAPLGPVTSEVVTATFYNFHPSRAARAVPDVWQIATPEQFVEARLRGVDGALRRFLGDEVIESAELAEAAELAGRASAVAQTAGRPLAAANAALPTPAEPHLALWQAQTLLRESRGDAHIAALVTAELDPCETLVMFAAEGNVEPDRLRTSRAWSEEEWAAAAARLHGRGLLADDATLTPSGSELRRWVEERTDRGSLAPWDELGPVDTERLVDLIAPFVQAIAAGGGFMTGNPMGLRPLSEKE